MFGSSKTEEVKKSPSNTTSASPNALNTLVKGSSMDGTLKCENDLRVDGNIKGKLICKAKLIVGPTGSIEGEVSCQNAVIEGSFRGTLRVAELLNIRETATVDGDIFTDKLIVQSGAKFNVACKMGGDAMTKIPEIKKLENHATAAGAKTQALN